MRSPTLGGPSFAGRQAAAAVPDLVHQPQQLPAVRIDG